MYLLRHSQNVHREEDGAVQFWRIKENLQNQFPHSPHWSDSKWKVCLAAGGGNKRRFQYCTDDSGTIVYFRALQGHSGRNLIDPTLQDNVLIPNCFFQYIYHVGCAFNLHSIISSGLIPGGQNSSKRDPMDKNHKDPDVIDLSVPRHAQYLHKAWKRHQNAVYWVDIDLAVEKGLKFHQTRSNAIILQETLPAYCIPKVGRLKKSWRSLIRKSVHVHLGLHRPVLKDLLEIDQGNLISRKTWSVFKHSLNFQWTFFHSQSMSSRREDLMATDMGKSQETKNIIWLTNWRRHAKRKSSKESMTDSYEIMNSVSEWLNIIEMKKFVDDGMFLQMKITLTIWQHKNTSTTRTNGGSIPISRVLTPYHWGNDLISSKRCLPWNVYTKKLEKNHTCLLIPTNTNNGSWHRVRLLHGGIGKIPGGLLKIQKVKEESSKVLRMNGETRYW